MVTLKRRTLGGTPGQGGKVLPQDQQTDTNFGLAAFQEAIRGLYQAPAHTKQLPAEQAARMGGTI